jgi:hypothetical protein
MFDRLVGRRPLHMINHHHIHKSLCGLQLQPQLLLHHSENVRGRVRVVSRRSTRSHTSGLRLRSIRRPLQDKVVPRRTESCLIDDRPLKRVVQNKADEFRDGRIHNSHSCRPTTIARIAIGIGVVHGKLRSAFCHGDGIHGKLNFLAMESKLKTIGQQLLNHHPHLLQAGLTLDVGLGGQVILICVKPRWSLRDLARVNFIGELDQVGERGVGRDKLAAPGGMDCELARRWEATNPQGGAGSVVFQDRVVFPGEGGADLIHRRQVSQGTPRVQLG